MTLEELKKQKIEKEKMKKEFEMGFHQLTGQIILLDEMIAKLESEEKK